jgi:hypothetical protein
MRCPSCEKFVSYDTEVEPEEQTEPEVTDQTVTAEYRRVLTCADCGEELKEATIEIDGEISCDLPCKETKQGKKLGEEEPEHEWTVESSSASATERSQTTDRHGRPITRARYMRHFYGVEVTVELKCQKCGTEHSQTFDNDEQASGFDELV